MPPAKTAKRGGDEEATASAPKRARVRDWGQYNHVPLNQAKLSKNGRQKGRNLITWNRPRMYEKLLLNIQYECARHRIELPWDNIAHRLNPGSSGGAISQQMTRLRQTLIAEGHMVPPVPHKPGGAKQDLTIRGFVRKFQDESGDYTTTRPVRWNEPLEDLKKNLPDAIDAIDAMDDDSFDDKVIDANIDADDLEDAELDYDTSDLVNPTPNPKNFTKREGSDDSYSSGDIKVPKTNKRPSRASAKKVSYVEVGENGSETSGGDASEAENTTTADAEENVTDKENEAALAQGSQPEQSASIIQQPFSAASLSAAYPPNLGVQPGFFPNPGYQIPFTQSSAFQQQAVAGPGTFQPAQSSFDSQIGNPGNHFVIVDNNGQSWAFPGYNLGDHQMLTSAAPMPMDQNASATVDSAPANLDLDASTPKESDGIQNDSRWNDFADIPSMFPPETSEFDEHTQVPVPHKNQDI